MEASVKSPGQSVLKNRVMKDTLCTNCGACVDLCPYQVSYGDRVAALFDCDREEGRCGAFCPRTETDLNAIRNALFEKADLGDELGAVRGFYLTRSSDPGIRRRSQHGGTVTALMHLALREGIIDRAVMNETGAGRGLMPGVREVESPGDVLAMGKSSFIASPTVAAFNRAVRSGTGALGVVALPCQALALAKMRMKPVPDNDNDIDRLKLVLGLFCGWTLSLRELSSLIESKIPIADIARVDIPPSRYQVMEVYTVGGKKIDIPLDEVNPVVRGNCAACFDMTAEFADLSVGSARLPEGWEEARKWNQMIVRTRTGEALVELARKKGVLEFRDVPAGNLDRLKAASLGKKRAAIARLREMSGSDDDLIYLRSDDPSLRGILG